MSIKGRLIKLIKNDQDCKIEETEIMLIDGVTFMERNPSIMGFIKRLHLTPYIVTYKAWQRRNLLSNTISIFMNIGAILFEYNLSASIKYLSTLRQLFYSIRVKIKYAKRKMTYDYTRMNSNTHDQYKDVKKSRELSYELSIERKTKRVKLPEYIGWCKNLTTIQLVPFQSYIRNSYSFSIKKDGSYIIVILQFLTDVQRGSSGEPVPTSETEKSCGAIKVIA
ncbi:hypothetical protein H8356DRAFT_1339664 [Neocallimastix lanati (nom. inval.)]|nr:hypothetical protein H8356DRAFT_1339664 [Neocallimastix sp. JGI-2020a]